MKKLFSYLTLVPCSRRVAAGCSHHLRVSVLALAAILWAPQLFAANQYWDINGATAGAGGATPSGLWDGTTVFWSANSSGTAVTTTWSAGNTAIFSAGADATGSYSITLSGTQTAGGLTFKDGLPTLTGGTLLLNGAGAVSVTGTKGIISSTIDGSVGLTKTGTGELVLQGANIFTGNLTNKAGILTLDNNQAGGAGSIVLQPGSPVTLRSSQTGTVLANNLVLGAGGSTTEIDADSGKTLTLSGVISGTHNWTANGPGVLKLTGTAPNTFATAFTIAQGTVLVAKDGALGGTANGTVVNSGATLSFTGGIDYTTGEAVTLNGTGVGGGAALDNDSGDNIFEGPVTMAAHSSIGAQATSSLTLIAPLTGGFNLTKVGAGELIIASSANGYANTLVSAGTLNLASGANGGSGLVTVNAGAVFAGEGSVAAGGVDLSGMISPGNGLPTTLASGSQTWEPGGSYDCTVNDATGTAGTDPGFSQLNVTGTVAINATTGNPFVIHLTSLDSGTDTPGDAADFDNTSEYSWTIATATGGFTGFSASKFSIETSGFSNPLGNGTFILEQGGANLNLRFVQKPQITTGPASQTIARFGSVTFNVAATGTATLHYQWFDQNNNPVGTDAPTYSKNNLAFADAGTYTVVVSNLSGYSATNTATLTVVPVTTVVSWNNPADITYGTPLSGTQLNATANTPGTFTYTPPLNTVMNAGNSQTLSVQFTPADPVDYTTPAPKTVTLNVSPASLSITANSTSKTYGQTVTRAGTEFTASGLVNGDTISGVTLTSGGLAATALVGGSPYAIVPSAATGSGLANYSITYHNGTLTVNPAGLTITANSPTKIYGQNLIFAGTEFSAGGLLNGDTVSSVTLTSAGATNTAGVAGSPYPITIGSAVGSGLGNYTIGYVNGTLTVTPALLGVTADPQSRLFGASNPVFTVTYNGWVNGEGVGHSDVVGAPSLTTVADTNSSVGSYAITVSLGTLAATNYSFALTNGTLTVAPAAITVTAEHKTRTYGAANPALTYVYAGFQNNDTAAVISGAPTISTTADANSSVAGSPYPITVGLGTLNAANYAFNFVNGSLEVTPASLTITAGNLTKTYGQTLVFSGTEFTPAGLQNAETVGSVTLTASGGTAATDGVGTYAITPSAATGGSFAIGNYAVSYVGGALTVITAPLTPGITANSKVYDGNNSVTLASQTVSPILNGDDVSLLVGAASFSDKIVANGKTVTATGLTLGGARAMNYVLTATTVTTTADITSRTLNITATGVNRTYDGTTLATVTLADNRVAGDVFTDSYASATFADKNAGTGKGISVSGISIAGADAANYVFNATATATADVSTYPLSVSAVTDTKQFDGTTASAAAPVITSGTLQGTDTAGFFQTFDTPNAGTNNKTLTPGGAVVDGHGGLNYACTFISTNNGTITAGPVPSIVYVDDNYTNLAANTFVSWPYAGAGTNIVGYNAFGTIQAGVNAVAAGGTVYVAPGTYAERVVISTPGVTVQGSGVTSVVTGTTAAPGAGVTPTVFKVAATGVTVSNFQMLVDFAFNHSAVHSSGTCTGLTVASNTIVASASASPAFSYGLRNAIAVNPNISGIAGYVLNNTGYNGVVVAGNTISGTGAAFFRAGIQIDLCGGSITGNTSTTINHDFITRFANQGDITVSGNTFLGGGAQFGSFNGGAGTVTISNNVFDNSIMQPGTGTNIGTGASLRLSYYAEVGSVNNQVVVAGNTFQNHRWAVSVEDFKNVTFDQNTFTPKAGSTDYVHMTFNTKIIASTSADAGLNMFPVGGTLTRNTFNGSGAPGGTALAFYNHRSPDAVFGTYTIGTAGNENQFNAGIAQFIKLDGSTGPSSAWTGFGEYAGVPATTMAPWSANLDVQNNAFDVGSGLTLPAAMSLADLFAVEDRLQHKLDNSALGLLRVKAANLFVTAASGSVQRGVGAASSGDTVNVNDGTYAGSLNLTNSVSLVSAHGAAVTTITGSAQTAVTIAADNVAVQGFTVSNPNAKWGIYAQNQNHIAITGNRVVDIGLTDSSALQSIGIGIGSYSANAVADVQIVGNLVSNVVSAGAWSGQAIVAGFSGGTANITGLIIASNRIAQVSSGTKGAYGILLNHATSPTGGQTVAPQIFNNEITGLTGGWAHAIGLEGNTPGAFVSGNLVSGITAAGTDAVGVQVEANAFASSVTITNNSFTGVYYGVQNVTANLVNAAGNWWGNVSGPASAANPGATGVRVTANVTFSPWLGDGTDTQLGAIGFQPNPSPLYSVPDHLAFAASPVGAGINTPFLQQPVVQVIDANGGLDTVFNGSVTVAVNSGTAGATLTSTLTQPVVAGVATFAGLQLDKAGSYTLVATSASPIASAVSGSFDVSNPLPSITSLTPSWAVAGDAGFSVTVTGNNYVYDSVVRWNGSARPTTYVSPTQLTATLSAGDIAAAGTAGVTVFNVSPGGGESTPATSFTIYALPPTVYVSATYSSGGANDGHLWGYDAFNSVQAGVNRVQPGGTVTVAAGTYVENVVANKAVTLLGCQKDVAACSRSGSESTIQSPAGGVAVAITGGGVVLNGFQIKNGIVTADGTGISIINNILSLDAGGLDAGSLGATPSGIRLGTVSGAITVAQNRVDVTGAPSVGGYTQAPLWGQLGWTGGAQPDFQNDDTGIDNGDGTFGDEKVTSAAAHSGSNAWRYSRGYGSPGQGTPYTPGLSAAVDADGKSLQATVWFKAVNPAGDNSSVAIETGTPDGTDRGNYLAFLNATPAGVEIVSYNNGANFDQVNLFSGVTLSQWHRLDFTLTKSGFVDAVTVSLDGGTPQTYHAALNEWRQSISSAYATHNRLKFRAQHPDGDPAYKGFYFDDISVQVLNPGSQVLASYSTGFESTPLSSLDGIALRGDATGATVAITNNCLAGADLGSAAGALQSAGVMVAASAPPASAQVTGNTVQGFATGINSVGASALTLSGNTVTAGAQLAGTTPTIGVALTGVAGPAVPVVRNNILSGSFYGYLLYAVNAGSPTVVSGGAISGVMQGVAVLNINPLTLSGYAPSLFAVDGVTLSGFTGNHPANPNNNFQAGVYVLTLGSSTLATVTGTITNVTITGTGKISPDSAGINLADFSTGAGVRQQITVQNSTISTNANRGVFVSGANAVANVSGSALVDNGFDPYATGGNHGFGIIARNNSRVTVAQSYVANPAAQVGDSVFALSAAADTGPQGPTLVVTNCSVVNNGNGQLANQSAGTLNASGNWWGGVDSAALAALMTGVVDFTPYLASGADTDVGTPGFQGDYSTLYVTTAGAQTGGGQRIQEGQDAATGASPVVIVEAGSYVESVQINKAGLTLKSTHNAGVDARGARNAESVLNRSDANGVVQIAAGNVTVDGLQIGAASVKGIVVGATASGVSVVNNLIGGSGTGVLVNGSAALQQNVATISGANGVGVEVSGASATAAIHNNNLTGNAEAGIKVDSGATVNAGDCITPGGNDLSGYGFDNAAPWAVENLNAGGTPAVLAQQNIYGAAVGNKLASLFSGAVDANQAGGLLVLYPVNFTVQCLGSVPSGATTLAVFEGQGGIVSATAATVAYSDAVVSTTVNNRVITRTYTLTDACGQSASASQIITVADTQPPVVTTWPADRTLDVGGNCSVAVPDLTAEVVGSDNCATLHIAQSPAANTYVSLGANPVTVTVSDDGGNATNHVVVLNVIDTRPAPTVVFVDGAYNGLPAGSVVKFPRGGGGADHYIGCDAFPAIQAGINRVAISGAVNVAGGRYVETINIDHPLSLLGPNAGVNPNTGARVAEAVIQPNVSQPDINGSDAVVVLNISASHVSVNGFTIDGYNPDLTGAYRSGTDQFNAAVGIGDYNADSAISIENNIVKNDAYSGIDFEAANDVSVATSDIYIRSNLVENMDYNTEGYGCGITLYHNEYAEIADNCLTNVAIGITPQWYYVANPGGSECQLIRSNVITASLLGIWYNLSYDAASTVTIADNTCAFMGTNGSALYGPAEWDGVELTSVQGVSAVATNNIVIGTTARVGYNTVGYNVWNTPTTGLVISGGSVSNVTYGVWLNNYDGYVSPANALTAATISDISISGCQSGVYVQDDPNAGGNAGGKVIATVTSNTVITQCGSGVSVQGVLAGAAMLGNNTSITGNAIGIAVDTGKALIQNNTLTNNSIAGILVTNGAVVDAGNCGADVTGFGVSTGGNDLSGYGFDHAAPWAILNANTGSTPAVLANHNHFGAVAGDNIAAAFQDPNAAVAYSQTPAVLTAATNVTVACVDAVPAGAATLAGLVAQGGYFSASSAVVSFADVTNLNHGSVGSGTITRTYTVADACGAASTATQVITVSDVTPPVILPLPNLTFSADPGQCSKSGVTWTVSASDSCAMASVVSVPPSGSTFAKGVTTVTNIATDTTGNSATNTFTVTVNDTEPPVIATCAAGQTISADVNGHALIPDLTRQVVASDNCGSVTVTQSPVAGTQVGYGDTVVTLTATDDSANHSSCTATITVVDRTPPVVTPPANVTVTTLQAKDPYFTGTATATDANPPVTISFNDDRSGLTNCDTTGVIVRTWTATDAAQNAASATQTITVVDTNAPYFTQVPANVVTTNDTGSCSAVVSYLPLAMDLGYYQGFEDVNWVSGDAANTPSTDWNDYNSHVSRVSSGTDGIASSSGSGHAVIDSTSALTDDSTGAFNRLGGYSAVFGTGYRVAQDVYINLSDAKIVSATAGSGYAWDLSAAASRQDGGYLRDYIFHAAAYDPTGVVIAADNNSADSVLTHADYRSVNHATLTSSGWYHFEWVFRDTNGVLAVDMNVRDAGGTVLFTETRSAAADLINSVVGGHRYLWFTFINADKLAVDNTILERNVPAVPSVASGTAFPVGTTTVTLNAVDACGNSTNTTFTVTVNDVQPPVIQPIADIVVTNILGNCTVPVNYAALVVTDNCAVAGTVATPVSGSAFAVGVTPVTVVAADIHGNTSTNHFNVSVVDTTATTIASALNPSIYGQAVALTATVTACPDLAPTGTVTFADGSTVLATVPVTAAQATLSLANLTAGTHQITATYSGDAYHTGSASSAVAQVVTPAALTVTGITANNKPYDGTPLASLNLGAATLNGIIPGDAVTLVTASAVGTFASPNIGNNLLVTISGLSLSGAAVNNYSLVPPTTAASILPASLTPNITAADKVYDGHVAAVITSRTLTGTIYNSDDVSLTGGTATFADAFAGTGKVVTATGLSLTGAQATNYVLTSTTATTLAGITPAALAVTANNATKGYGQAFAFAGTEFTTLGLTNGDSVASVTLSSTGATNTAVVGSYGIVPSAAVGSGLGNYTIAYHPGSLTVTAAVLTVVADNQVRVYGATNPVFTVSYSGFVNGEATNVLSGAALLACAAETNSPVGNYVITNLPGDLAAQNYSFIFSNGTLTVSQAAILVKANNQTRTYGAANPTLTVSYSGFLVGDDASIISGAPVVHTVADTNSPVGNYDITVAPGTVNATNYSFITSNGVLAVTPAALTITAADQTKTYGQTLTLAGTEFSAGGLQNGETIGSVTLTPSGGTQPADPAGHYTLTPSAPSGGTFSAGNYAISYVNGTLTVNPLAIAVTANPQTKVYGTADPALTYSFAPALVGTDSFSGALTRTSGESVGSYAITQGSLALSANYTLTYAGDNLTITPAALSVTAASQTKGYGQTVTLAGTEFTTTGLVYSDTVTLVTLTSAGTTNTAPVATYPIVPSAAVGSGLGNYAVTYNNGSLVVTSAVLLVTADNQARIYGATNPVLTASYTGFVNGENTNVLTGAPSLVTSATTNSPVGSYVITNLPGDLAAQNYSFVFSNGTLTVAVAAVTPSIAAGDKVYDQTTTATLTASNLTGVLFGNDVTLQVGAANFASKNVGSQTVTATGLTLGGADAANYILTTNTATTTAGITPRALLVTATGVDKVYDGGTSASVTLSDDKITGDDVSETYATASFADKNVGPAKPVSVGGISITGADAANYSYNATATATAAITTYAITVSAVTDTKSYDGNTSSAGVPTIVPGLRGTDSSGFTQTFDTPTAGTGKTLSASGSVNDGNGGNNYAVTLVANDTGVIGTIPLTITANNFTKVYDGLAYSGGNGVQYAGFTNGETAAVLGGTLTYGGTSQGAVNAGSYQITPGGLTSPNYSLTFINGNLSVTPATLTVTAENKARVYGTTNPVLTASYSGFVNGEGTTVLSGEPLLTCPAVTNSPIGTYVITAAAGDLSATNYSFAFVDGTLTVAVAALTPNITAADKVYDAGTNVTLTSATVTGVLAGDEVTLQVGAASFADKTVANGKTVTATLLTLAGAQATNYILNTNLVTTLANITPATLTVTGAVVTTKIYDGTPAAAITGAGLNGVLGADVVSLDQATSGTFADVNVNPVIAVATTMAISGVDAANYTLTPPVLAGAITPAPLSITANDASKIYDGMPYSGGNGVTYNGFVHGETPSVLGGTLSYGGSSQGAVTEGTYAIVPSGLTAGNYTLTFNNGVLTVSAVTPAFISLSPASQTNNATTTATFVVNVTGPSSYTNYQWIKITPNTTNVLADGGNVSGATSNVLTIANVLAADQATYAVTISNPAGSVSTNATLTVIDPAILGQPQGSTNALGSTVVFAVTAAGTGTLSYQWQQDGFDLPGANSSTLTIHNVQDSDEGDYTVLVYNDEGIILSEPAALVLTHPPVVVAQPASQIVNEGGTVTFSVSVNGTSPFSYQWKKNGTAIAGATSRTLVLTGVTFADQAGYSVTVNNADGSVNSGVATLTVIVPPAITTQPLSLTNNAGTVASFAVTTTGTAPVYRWFKVTPAGTNALTDTGNVSGSTNAVLTLTNVLGGDAATYFVVASNRAGVVVSSNAQLTVMDPVILTQPASVTVNRGQPAGFAVSAAGTALHYQWFKGGVAITGATTPTYGVANAQPSDENDYSVVITNVYGSVTSAPSVHLTVIDPPVIVGQPLSRTNNAGTTATFTVGYTGTAPSFQWYKGVTAITAGTNATLTLLNVQQADVGSYNVTLSNAAGTVTSAGATLTVIDAPVIVSQPLSRTNNAGTTATFTVSYTGTAPSFQWLTNGIALTGATNQTLTLNNVSQANAVDYTVVLSNAAGSVTSAPPAHLTVIDPPVIVGQPLSRTNNAGTTATFTVSYTGTTPVFQWYKGVTAIADGTNATLTLLNVQQADAASYNVTLSNAAGTVTSAGATLTVIDAPVIVNQPLSRTNNAGTTATFTVSYTGTAPSFQWLTNGIALTGATNQTLTLNNVSQANAVDYTVVLSNAAGSVTSAPPAHLTVIDPPVIVGQPLSRTNNAGTTATFTVSYTGTTPVFQWYKGVTAIADGTNATLTLLNVQQADAASYNVTLSNAAGTVTSAGATLTVIDAPVIVNQPLSRTNNAGTTATFTVSVSGTAPFGYQWFKVTASATNLLVNGGNLTGVNGNVLTVANVFGADQAGYFVTVTNPAGVISSANASLVVRDPIIATQPVGSTNFVGSTTTLSVTAMGTPGLTYQWFQNGAAVFGATSNSLTLSKLTDADAGTYTVVVANSFSSVTSSPALLVTLAPLITTQPASYTAVLGMSASFSVSVSGQPPFAYQWQKNGVNISGATNRIFTISAADYADAGQYRVIVSNPLAVQTSLNATLSVTDLPVLTLTLSNRIPVLSVRWYPTNLVSIDATTNLANPASWIELKVANPPFSILDTNAPLLPYRFYRAHGNP